MVLSTNLKKKSAVTQTSSISYSQIRLQLSVPHILNNNLSLNFPKALSDYLPPSPFCLNEFKISVNIYVGTVHKRKEV